MHTYEEPQANATTHDHLIRLASILCFVVSVTSLPASALDSDIEQARDFFNSCLPLVSDFKIPGNLRVNNLYAYGETINGRAPGAGETGDWGLLKIGDLTPWIEIDDRFRGPLDLFWCNRLYLTIFHEMIHHNKVDLVVGRHDNSGEQEDFVEFLSDAKNNCRDNPAFLSADVLDAPACMDLKGLSASRVEELRSRGMCSSRIRAVEPNCQARKEGDAELCADGAKWETINHNRPYLSLSGAKTCDQLMGLARGAVGRSFCDQYPEAAVCRNPSKPPWDEPGSSTAGDEPSNPAPSLRPDLLKPLNELCRLFPAYCK